MVAADNKIATMPDSFHPPLFTRTYSDHDISIYSTYYCAYNSRMNIEFDPKKAASNLKKYGVPFDEAASCLLDPLALVRNDPDAEAVRLISARKATKNEVNYYAQGI